MPASGHPPQAPPAPRPIRDNLAFPPNQLGKLRAVSPTPIRSPVKCQSLPSGPVRITLSPTRDRPHNTMEASFAQPVDKVLAGFGVTAKAGLTDDQVIEARTKHGKNCK